MMQNIKNMLAPHIHRHMFLSLSVKFSIAFVLQQHFQIDLYGKCYWKSNSLTFKTEIKKLPLLHRLDQSYHFFVFFFLLLELKTSNRLPNEKWIPWWLLANTKTSTMATTTTKTMMMTMVPTMALVLTMKWSFWNWILQFNHRTLERKLLIR